MTSARAGHVDLGPAEPAVTRDPKVTDRILWVDSSGPSVHVIDEINRSKTSPHRRRGGDRSSLWRRRKLQPMMSAIARVVDQPGNAVVDNSEPVISVDEDGPSHTLKGWVLWQEHWR